MSAAASLIAWRAGAAVLRLFFQQVRLRGNRGECLIAEEMGFRDAGQNAVSLRDPNGSEAFLS